MGADHHVRETRREKGIMVAARKCKKNSVRMTKLWGKVGIWREELWRTRALWKRTELCGRTLGETRNRGGETARPTQYCPLCSEEDVTLLWPRPSCQGHAPAQCHCGPAPLPEPRPSPMPHSGGGVTWSRVTLERWDVGLTRNVCSHPHLLTLLKLMIYISDPL